MQKLNIFSSCFLLSLLLACTPANNRDLADQYSKEKKYDEAIQEYRNHIQNRLAITDRPEWENPYLYFLDIGDVYLEKGDVKNALKHYNLAAENGINQSYIADRYRYVANWYAKRGDIKAALKILETYRDTDPLLFDLMLDRLARQLIDEEDNKQEETPTETQTN